MQRRPLLGVAGDLALVTENILAGALLFSLVAAQTQQPAPLPDSPAPQQQSLPDAPGRQNTLPAPGSIAPGSGAPAGDPDALQNAGATAPGQNQIPGATPAAAAANDADEPDIPPSGDGPKYTLNVRTNFVEIPFTVKDAKNQLVPGLAPRDIRVFENNVRQQMRLFTVDPFPLSVALVIDQSVAFNEAAKINNSLGALQNAFTPYDEIAVFTYNNTPTMRTDFTAAQSARLGAVLEQSKSAGRDGAFAYTTGPLSQGIYLNSGAQEHINPLTNPSKGTSQSSIINVPRESHTLNDAILEAAKATARAGKGRRRIVYVISDGKEFGSTAKTKEVIRYLQTNQIAVYGTLVHDLPNVKGEGFLDRVHLPLQLRDNILPVYADATGGQLDPEFRQGGIERSFARIAEQVRTQYTVGYYSNEPMIDGKYRQVEIKVLRPNLTVIAKKGFYPTASDARPAAVRTAAQ